MNLSDLFQTAVTHHQRGELQPAEQIYQHILTVLPHQADTLRLLGTLYHQQGNWAAAKTHYNQLLQLRPDNAEVHYNLGLILEQQGDLTAALAHYRHALHYHPTFAAAYPQLGQALAQQGHWAEAVEVYQAGLKHVPQATELHYHCGVAYQAQGQWAAAQQCYQDLLFHQPAHALAYNNLGVIAQKQGDLALATTYYQRALSYQPHLPEAHNNLGVLFQLQGQLEEAITCFRQAIAGAAQPSRFMAQVWDNLGVALQRQGQPYEAVQAFEQSLTGEARPEVQLKLALTLPVIYSSLDEVMRWRQRLEQQLPGLKPKEVEATADTVSPNFLSAYQGFNDIEIQRQLGQLYRPASPSFPLKRQRKSRLKIGFISKYFKNHTIGLLNRGVIAQLSRDQFEVVVLSLGSYPTDPLAQFFRQHADLYLELPDEVKPACAMIAALGLDVLYYTDIGMEPLSYALALHRLAPVQCVSWGHPLTTGLDTIDYFISSQLYEPPNASAHYHEKLIQLSGLNTYYYHPHPSQPQPSNLPTTYLCPQSLFKFHPEFDPILREILQRDSEGQLLILSGLQTTWNELLLNRWRKTMPDVLNRVQFSPRLNQTEFIASLAQATVILDTPHFCGGNTSLEALAVGAPIVTMPSAYLRGRLTLGFYRKMGWLELVAQTPAEYVNLAVKLGTDPRYRAHMRDEILQRNHCLYEDIGSVRELETFLFNCRPNHE